MNYKLIIKIGLLLLAVCFIIGIYQFVNHVPRVKEAVVLATTVKPETFTELYFEDHLSLPSKITYNRENKFKFTIHNLENKDMNYPYEVYIDVNGGKQVIDKKSIFIKNNESKTIDEDFTLVLTIERVEVTVNLINKNQQIDFWMEKQ
jgi:hypothetical protein